MAESPGLQRFIRYAYPPNQRGFCGPSDHAAIRTYARTGLVDQRLAEMARQFDGPLPYLRVLAAAAGVEDPFDGQVVETYWLGGPLLDAVDPAVLASEVEATFRGQPTVSWPRVEAALPGGAATHAWHVLVTYPWLGFLDHPGGHAIGILDQCRIRWGRVDAVAADGSVTVTSQPLEYTAGRLVLGEPRPETTAVSVLGAADRPELAQGAMVALHWAWICDALSDAQVQTLAATTRTQVELVNRELLDPPNWSRSPGPGRR